MCYYCSKKSEKNQWKNVIVRNEEDVIKNEDLFAKQKAEKGEKADEKKGTKSKKDAKKADDKSKAVKDRTNDETCSFSV